MARTKKTETNTEPIVEEIKKEDKVETSKPEVSTASGLTVGYQGKIDITIKKGNRTISRKTYHNAGHTDLFNFLYDCLVGEYQKLNRPCKIKLYKIKDETEKGDDPNSWCWNSDLAVTPYAISTSHAAVNLIDGTKKAAVFEFKIPFSFITDAIYKAALFPNTVLTEGIGADQRDSNLYATFGFTKEDKTWNEIDRQSAVGNYSLQLTWTMTFQNVDSSAN